jgi:crotonobetainyl-CoA:carnitine CoA-transferase CaiB-like acyl-CoA transferase
MDGLRVLDFTRATAGAFATRWLADFGADVIKVEPPGGDLTRRSSLRELEDGTVQSAWLTNPDDETAGLGPVFLYNNVGKRSLGLNMNADGALEFVLSLAARCDIIIENFTPHVFRRWGLDYASLSAVNPGIIYVHASGFGYDAPDTQRPCTEPVAIGMSGFAHVNGEAAGYPLIDGTGIGDPLSGTTTALGILAALVHKLRTGIGQHVDSAMVDTLFCHDVQQMPFVVHSRGRYQPSRQGRLLSQLFTPCGTFRLGDEYLVIEAHGEGANSGWGRLCTLMGRLDLMEHPAWLSDTARASIQPEVWSVIEEWLDATYESAEQAAESIAAARIVAVKVYSPNEAAQLEHYRRRNMIVESEHPLIGSVPVINTPLKFSKTPTHVGRAPLLGEHNEEILSEVLGLDATEIQELYAGGLLHQAACVAEMRPAPRFEGSRP